MVSGDIYSLLNDWANKKNFILPQEEYFSILREEFAAHFKQIFPSFEFIPEEEILQSAANLLLENELPIISLDQVYFKNWSNLEITRLADEHGNDTGIRNRAGTPPLEEQLAEIKKSGFKKVALADDVIFSGKGITEVILPILSEIGINVETVYAGIGILDGIKKISGAGIEVQCVRSYKEVIDQICERDFYPGVSLCGRTLDNDKNIGIPYILPFGRPTKWASIPPQYIINLSKFCLKQTIDLFVHIEESSNRIVFGKDLDRKVIGMTDNLRFIEELEIIANRI